MIFGADTQNKNLRDASSKRIDTSHRTQTANKYAAAISSSKNTSVGSDESGPKSVEHSKSPNTSDSIKGSFEGYMSGSSAHVQMNGSGYLNTSMQSARYSKGSSDGVGSIEAAQFTKSSGYSIMNNTSRSYQQGSSAQRMTEINKRNNMI